MNGYVFDIFVNIFTRIAIYHTVILKTNSVSFRDFLTMELRYNLAVFFISMVLVLCQKKNRMESKGGEVGEITSPEFRLFKGLQDFEGIVQVKLYKDWFNICAENFTEEHAKAVCKLTPDTSDSDSAEVLDATEEINKTVSTDDLCLLDKYGCDGIKSKTDIETSYCKSAVICCLNEFNYEVGCSGNWFYVHEQAAHRTVMKPTSFSLLNTYNFTNDSNFDKFWTTSALAELPTNISYNLLDDDRVMKCTNECLLSNKLDLVIVKFDSCECTNSSTNITDSRIFEIVDINTDYTVNICIAATVQGKNITLEAEYCNRTYRDQRFKLSLLRKPDTIKTTTKSLSKVSPNGDMPAHRTTAKTTVSVNAETTISQTVSSPLTTPMDSAESNGSLLSKENIFLVTGIALVSIIVVIIIIICCVVYLYRKVRKGPREASDNVVNNRTYSKRMTLNHCDMDEEYANILDSDVGISDVTSVSYRPQLPSRENDNYSGEFKGHDIITLDNYSTPRDTLKICIQDEYSITYDDPIRINVTPDETNNKVECNLKPKKKSERKLSDKTVLERKVSDKTVLERKVSDKSVAQRQVSEKSITERKISDKTLLERKLSDKTVLERKLSDKTVLERKLSDKTGVDQRVSDKTIEDCDKEIDKPVDTETVDNSDDIKGDNKNRVSDYEITDFANKITVSIDDKSDSENSEYEITFVDNGNDNLKKTCILSEHVCLDCLTPAHLKALGITIVPDDNEYSKCKDLSRRFSAPCRACHCDTEACSNCEIQLEEMPKHSNDIETSTNHSDKMKCAGNSETCVEKDGNKRKCSVCHSEYDRIGKYDRKDWIKYTENVYEKFGHFTTFNVRNNNGTIKRINST